MSRTIRMAAFSAALFVSAVHAGEFRMLATIPYSEDSVIAGNIKRECTIDSQLAQAVKRNAEAAGNHVELVANLDTGGGEVLKLEIFEALSSGNAWMGHHKSVTVKGALYRDGQQVARVNIGGQLHIGCDHIPGLAVPAHHRSGGSRGGQMPVGQCHHVFYAFDGRP